MLPHFVFANQSVQTIWYTPVAALLYTTFNWKGTAIVYLLLTNLNGAPFSNLVAVNALCFRCEKII